MMLGLAPNWLFEVAPRPARPRRLVEYTIPFPVTIPVRKDISTMTTNDDFDRPELRHTKFTTLQKFRAWPYSLDFRQRVARDLPSADETQFNSYGPPHLDAGFCPLNRDSCIQSQRTCCSPVLVLY